MLDYIYIGSNVILGGISILFYFRLRRNSRLTYKLLKETVSELDMKDPYFNGHTVRVLKMLKKIGKKMKLKKKDLLQAEMALYISEIAKLRIPDKVILKREKLTKEEYGMIQKHPILAYKMIEKIKELKKVGEIVKAHHEKYDGTGYPYKLKAEEIPVEARIIHLSDSYDAMTSERPYKTALSKEKAVEEILSQKGKQFDPQVVDAFINELD